MKKKVLLAFLVFVFASFGIAQDVSKEEKPRPRPDIENGIYGEFERNVFDLWKPISSMPTPLIVYIH